MSLGDKSQPSVGLGGWACVAGGGSAESDAADLASVPQMERAIRDHALLL